MTIRDFEDYLNCRPIIEKLGRDNWSTVAPANLVDFWKWMLDEKRTKKSYRAFKKQVEQKPEIMNYLKDVMEKEVIANALVGNFSPTFAEKYLKQKNNWDAVTNTKIEIKTQLEDVELSDIAEFLKENADIFKD